jgi:hypothetical protein
MATTFKRVKEILNTEMTAWRNAPANSKDKNVDLRKKHGNKFPLLDADFTADDLKNGVARGLPLIQPNVAGKDTNLVKVLSEGLPQSGVEQMPGGGNGPYIAPGQIQEIADWIDAGCPPI